MNAVQLGLLIWAILALAVCLFVHGAKQDHKGAKAKRDAEHRQAWINRLTAKHLQ